MDPISLCDISLGSNFLGGWIDGSDFDVEKIFLDKHVNAASD